MVAVRGKQLALDRPGVVRRVHPGRAPFGHDHLNFYAILQRAQLLEGFCLLQRRGFPADEAQEQFAAITVDALVAEVFRRSGCVARKGIGQREK